jgi:hypothetical protein
LEFRGDFTQPNIGPVALRHRTAIMRRLAVSQSDPESRKNRRGRLDRSAAASSAADAQKDRPFGGWEASQEGSSNGMRNGRSGEPSTD